MKKLSLMAALTLSTMLSACGGGGGGHGYIPPSTLPDNPDQPVVSCTGVTCMTNEGLSNSAKRSELYNAATGGKTRMRMFARSGGNPIDEAYNNMHLALTGWAAPDGSGSLDISDPDLRQNLVLAGFENLPEDDGELQEWAKARQYLIKRHAEKAYKMYGKQNNDVRLDNVKLHLVEETSNQDTFINFTLDNKKNINGIEISENDFTSEAVTNKLDYKGGDKFSGSDKLHIYNLYCNDSMGKNGPRLYIEISGYDDEEPDLDFIKEKLRSKCSQKPLNETKILAQLEKELCLPMNISDEMLKNIQSEVKRQLKEERVNTATLKRDITIKINKLDEEAKTLFRGYIQGKCDEKMYNELKTEIELEKEKLQKDMDRYLEIDTETDEMLANIAEIAANVGKFLKSPILSTKRDILNLILSDCKTEGKNLCFTITKPFDKLLKTPEINKWCR